MNDKGIRIEIPKGPRAAIIRECFDRSKALRVDSVQRKIAESNNPELTQTLGDLLLKVQKETVQDFVIGNFRDAVISGERALKNQELKARVKALQAEEAKTFMDRFKEL